jgi:FkbM family methyltransferase
MIFLRKISTFFRYLYKYGVVGGIGFFIKERLPLNDLMKVKINQTSNPVTLRRNTSDVDTFHEIFLFDGYKLNLVFEPEIIIDCGANIGLAAIYFKNRYPKSRIVSIEPETANFELLVRNTSAYNTIQCRQQALSSESGKELNVINAGYGNWGFITDTSVGKDTRNVVNKTKTISINALVEELGVDVIDIVKIDIEGFEYELFESNTEWLEKTRCLIIEVHDRFKPGSSRAVFKALSACDFSFDVSGENLIFINNKL